MPAFLRVRRWEPFDFAQGISFALGNSPSTRLARSGSVSVSHSLHSRIAVVAASKWVSFFQDNASMLFSVAVFNEVTVWSVSAFYSKKQVQLQQFR
ncbi:MAG: hypothetical protein A2785_00935 [Candidatus Chisholmbacteria bacterium RIFCSPHIGHO2_01_FULL_49_18]|uniref:Uncharacterized protein n=1 Tax=Candidatus Chisholmbacteria bacterium RIFCSPHIGHO2_01_FULL_49_18 TaxID=1797590 RepID=A0A1G1VL63_9BACT|nr:MAG: hypothetical protein A2785_00935 [Candidatus Chisholmbacteria bacterium RIFCSPHIGHO2_01_FULL_49_18]